MGRSKDSLKAAFNLASVGTGQVGDDAVSDDDKNGDKAPAHGGDEQIPQVKIDRLGISINSEQPTAARPTTDPPAKPKR